MSKHATPWDVYAEQLFPKGYGHPLWIPEPTEREVLLGDVGWIKKGQFCPLFNTLLPKTNPINRDSGGVPQKYVRINVTSKLAIGKAKQEIQQKTVHSGSMRVVDTTGKIGGGRYVIAHPSAITTVL